MGSGAKSQEGLPKNAKILSPYMRRSLVIYDFAPDPSEFPDKGEKFYFLFYQCRQSGSWSDRYLETIEQRRPTPRRVQQCFAELTQNTDCLIIQFAISVYPCCLSNFLHANMSNDHIYHPSTYLPFYLSPCLPVFTSVIQYQTACTWPTIFLSKCVSVLLSVPLYFALYISLTLRRIFI